MKKFTAAQDKWFRNEQSKVYQKMEHDSMELTSLNCRILDYIELYGKCKGELDSLKRMILAENNIR